jgi:hypothetical protein
MDLMKAADDQRKSGVISKKQLSSSTIPPKVGIPLFPFLSPSSSLFLSVWKHGKCGQWQQYDKFE